MTPLVTKRPVVPYSPGHDQVGGSPERGSGEPLRRELRVRVAVRFRGVHKRYPGVHAVRGVELDVRAGAVHGLVGENGAGKSTLVKMLAGAVALDAGAIEVFGGLLESGRPVAARRAGIAAIYQEPTIVPKLSPVANVFLNQARSRGGLLARGEMRTRFAELCSSLGVSLPEDGSAGDLSIWARRSIEVMRALEQDARVVIFDEATAALPRDEREAFYGVIRMLRDERRTLIFISHDLDEVLALCDVVSVMRDGEHVVTRPAGDLSKEKLVQHMLGSRHTAMLERAAKLVRVERPADSAEVLRVDNVHVPPKLRDVSFAVQRGEIVAVAGLAGSGRTTLLRAIAGAEPASTGRIWLDGRELRWPTTPRHSLRAGVVLAPEDRRAQGLVLGRSAAENIVRSSLRQTGRGGLLLRRHMVARGSPAADQVGFPIQRLNSPAGTFSGGNQQKIVLAQGLVTAPKLMLLDEPFRGIDVGARAEIISVLLDLTRTGVGLVIASEELEELLPIAHRTIVLANQTIVAELRGTEMTLDVVLHHMFPVR